MPTAFTPQSRNFHCSALFVNPYAEGRATYTKRLCLSLFFFSLPINSILFIRAANRKNLKLHESLINKTRVIEINSLNIPFFVII